MTANHLARGALGWRNESDDWAEGPFDLIVRLRVIIYFLTKVSKM